MVHSDFLLKPFDFLLIAIGVPCGSFWFPFDAPVKPFNDNSQVDGTSPV